MSLLIHFFRLFRWCQLNDQEHQNYTKLVYFFTSLICIGVGFVRNSSNNNFFIFLKRLLRLLFLTVSFLIMNFTVNFIVFY